MKKRNSTTNWKTIMQVVKTDEHNIMECFDQTISTDMRVHNALSYILFEILETKALHYKLLWACWILETVRKTGKKFKKTAWWAVQSSKQSSETSQGLKILSEATQKLAFKYINSNVLFPAKIPTITIYATTWAFSDLEGIDTK